jgi:hypothetical protein
VKQKRGEGGGVGGGGGGGGGGGKGGLWVRLATLPLSCADCLEI